MSKHKWKCGDVFRNGRLVHMYIDGITEVCINDTGRYIRSYPVNGEYWYLHQDTQFLFNIQESIMEGLCKDSDLKNLLIWDKNSK